LRALRRTGVGSLPSSPLSVPPVRPARPSRPSVPSVPPVRHARPSRLSVPSVRPSRPVPRPVPSLVPSRLSSRPVSRPHFGLPSPLPLPFFHLPHQMGTSTTKFLRRETRIVPLKDPHNHTRHQKKAASFGQRPRPLHNRHTRTDTRCACVRWGMAVTCQWRLFKLPPSTTEFLKAGTEIMQNKE
jgi:hypothetical protein